jgi:hypothetical protein
MSKLSSGNSDLIGHYSKTWGNHIVLQYNRNLERVHLNEGFCICIFEPTKTRRSWVYSTCGLAEKVPEKPVEVFLYTPVAADEPVDILLSVADYHISGAKIGLNHTVNFGIPWLPGSSCEYGFLSQPYLENEAFRTFRGIEYLWIVPITRSERDFKVENGAEELERKFEEVQLNYLDPARPAVV